MPDFDRIDLTKVLVGGEPVGFTKSTGTLHLAGRDYTLEEWQELERRINLFYERSGMVVPGKGRDPNAGSSSFLTRNLRRILDSQRGVMKPPPFWLRWLYDGVITKEEYSGDSI